MTDRVRSLTVILDRDMRTDDVQHVVEAISMLRYVSKVELGEPVDMSDYTNRTVIKREILDTVFNMLK